MARTLPAILALLLVASRADTLVITPGTGPRDGRSFDVPGTSSSGSCCTRQPASLAPLAGSGIVTANPRTEGNGCALVETLTIEPSALAGETSIAVQDAQGQLIGRVPFVIADAVPAIPAGLDPQ